MKTILFTSIFILICTILSAQAPNGTFLLEDPAFNSYFIDSDKIPTVTGRIRNLSPDSYSKIKISYSIVTPFYDFQIKRNTNVSSDGSFFLQLDYPFPYQQIWLSIGDSLYTCLYVNTDLSIELDAASVDKKKGISFSGEGLVFKGTDGELTRLMNNHILFKRNQQLEISREIQSLSRTSKVPYNEFLQKLEKLYTKLRMIDTEFLKENPSKFGWLIENERTSRYYAELLSNSLNDMMDDELWLKINNHKSFSISNDGMSFYRNLIMYISITSGKYRIDDWNSIGKYSKIDDNGKKLIDSLVFYQKTKNLKQYNKLAGKAFTTFSDTLAAISTIKAITFLDANFIPVKADYLKIKLGSMDQNEQITIFDLVSKNLTTPWCKNVINSELQNLMASSQEVKRILQDSKPVTSNYPLGQPIAELPFGARLFKLNNVQASDLLGNIKNTFKGKAILLDFWATWCAPCLSEMPYSIKLQQGAKNLPIEFVYLCTSNNSSQEKWKQKIAELKIPGTHIFVEETVDNKLLNLFSGKGFPTYVFIDSKGVYKSGFIRPSATDLKTLERLLENK
jgi:thiol-disulfide isomerase/thioredoxin